MSLTREQVLFADLAKAMKKTVARQANESDSDSEIQQTTNRGNKLKKRARFVRQGKLGPPTGPSVYKEARLNPSEVEHAGYKRAVISRNPPLIDEDGYSIDSDDDDQHVQDAVAAAAEADPYSSIHLEQLLAPLTTVTDLPAHPTLSRPFKSTALKELANQACDLMHKENVALWKTHGKLGTSTEDAVMTNSEDNKADQLGTVKKSHETSGAVTEEQGAQKAVSLATNGDKADEPGSNPTNGILAKQKGKQSGTRQDTADDDVVMLDGSAASGLGAHSNHNGSRAASPSAASVGEPFIHPIFLAPKPAHPDRDLGLPEQEAEDVRRLLQLYVQKQEEVCRGTEKLYHGLLKADRMRKTVLEWSKSEAHVGEMSDGEDWYDKEEWGLTEDLKKGQDEEEEDTTQTQKKTRNRK
ncbi:putative rxt2-like protein [Diaporthe ampelina]|uniref:Putative rxt2-like protein n=1 Tax=Diaporthe ampelina TaxID=1214573 RepID=A0A0G2FKM2_9PEZI|nr:putative rxt2-like protein [Diaporthe ampelina]